MKKHTLFIIFIMAIALTIGIWREKQNSRTTHTAELFSQNLSLTVGTAISPAKPLAPFQFTDMNGKPFSVEQMKNRWSFVFFGYSSCPDICPVTLTALHQIALRVRAIPTVQFVFVSLDPAKDTPEKLKAFLEQDKYKEARFIGVTGKKENLYSFAQSLGITALPNEDPAKIDHSGTILLINPKGECAGIFSTSDKPHLIAHDLKEIMHRTAQGMM